MVDVTNDSSRLVLPIWENFFEERRQRMSVKRRDNKNRVLRNGESQRKDGRYAFKYLDSEGNPNFVYSWKLVDTDALPAGKRECISLRDKEFEILKTINDDSIPKTEYITVLELVEKYILQKKGVRHSTRAGYKTVINLLKAKEKEFGSKRINEVKLSDAKQWLIDMQQNERGYFYSVQNGTSDF